MTEEKENKLRSTGTNLLGYTTRRYRIGKDELKEFDQLSNTREIRKSNVNKLRTILKKGLHFETPLMCNKKGSKLRLLDGNHRFLAIQEFLEEYPQRKVEVILCIYENLTAEEEKKEYTKWNLGTKQSTNDFVKQYWNEIPITKFLTNGNFPCGVQPYKYGANLEFKQLLSPYLAWKSKGTTTIMQASGATSFIEQTQELVKQDVNVLGEFMNDFVEVFGIPDCKNLHYKRVVFSAIMNIWLKNYDNNNSNVMRRRLLKIRNCERVMYWGQTGFGRENANFCRENLLQQINKGYVKNLFV